MDDKNKRPDIGPYITLSEAAQIAGLHPGTLRRAAADGKLKTAKLSPRLSVTTRRWLDDYRRHVGTTGTGRPAKPLPDDYIAPPRRGRPPKRSEGSTAYNIDADLDNADWAKRTWDLDGTADEQAAFIIGGSLYPTAAEKQENVDRFMRLPAARAMPDAVKRAIEQRGFTVDSGEQKDER